MNTTLLCTRLPALQGQEPAALHTTTHPRAARISDLHDPSVAAPAMQLRPGGLITLRRVKGRVMRVHTGRVWITESGDLADHFVAAGQSYTVRGNGRVVVQCDSAISATWSA